jgi:hypothetical protein
LAGLRRWLVTPPFSINRATIGMHKLAFKDPLVFCFDWDWTG